MGTNKMIGVVLIVVGAVLLYFGFQATDAPLEQVRETVTGDYSDRTMFYLMRRGRGGAACSIGGRWRAVAGVLLAVVVGKRARSSTAAGSRAA